uniref:RING-type E3 ubiquitin transferase n=1 Tax=Castor canadensis TaxID=51338 RepID=A0A8C0WHT2_CASCN
QAAPGTNSLALPSGASQSEVRGGGTSASPGVVVPAGLWTEGSARTFSHEVRVGTAPLQRGREPGFRAGRPGDWQDAALHWDAHAVSQPHRSTPILTVQLFASLNLLPVEADILAYNFENASQTFEDLPARFGYRLPAEGLKGFLINSKPENACEPIMPPPLRDNSSGTFVVLIRRLDCNFDVKVLNAQRAGYKAAIVHNVDSDDLISMGSNDIEVLKKIDIPSVFIGESSANSLKDEFTYEKGSQNLFRTDTELEETDFVEINLRNSQYISSRKETSTMCVPFAWMSMKMETNSGSFPVPTRTTASV